MKLVKFLDHARSVGCTSEMIEAMKGNGGKYRDLIVHVLCKRCFAEIDVDEESMMDEKTHDAYCPKCVAAMQGRN